MSIPLAQDPAAPTLAGSARTPSFESIDKKNVDDFESTVTRDDLAEPDPDSSTKFSDILLRRRRRAPLDLDAIATKRSVYDDPSIAKHYWPKKEYENYHRFDPNARWTVREEKALVRKLDWRVMLWACITFSALNIDRNNLGNANSDNFLGDLGLTTNDFNWGNSIFKLAFLAAELPSQMVSKRLGPDRWIPTQMCAWSIVTLAQFWLTGRSSFFVCRALLGFIQGGRVLLLIVFIPDLILYLSYFYTKTELPLRLAWFWMSSDICAIVSSFLSYGILHLRGVAGKEGWRWLFLIEGLITLSIGLATFFMMPPSPSQTRTWFRPNGWFTEREEYIVVSRVLRDDPTKGDMHNREGLTLKRLWQAATDYDLWPLYIFGKHLTNLGIALVSEFVNERSFVASAQDVWSLPFLVAIYCLPAKPNPWVYYGLATALLSYPYTHPIQVAWCSRNSGAVASRTVNASLYNMFVQASGVISSQIYRKDDAPRYRRGNRVLIAITVINIAVLYPGTKVYYIWRNKQRAKIWDAMSPEERSEYLSTTKDIGNRRLDFRFAH
ncbi:allantoate permease [Peniophora sp. CONT]|nr:allantoate permease [Peniophora sp. CONT]